MDPNVLEIAATACFAAAIVHTFLAGKFRFPTHLELVFPIWALAFLVVFVLARGPIECWSYFHGLNFAEPVFVFVIMTVMSAPKILNLASFGIDQLAEKIPLKRQGAVHFFLCMTMGPLLGSLITEPAAMTVTAMILLNTFYRARLPDGLKYVTLGALFVNVSIGGTLTNYAAPPVVMVAKVWDWDTPFMFLNFGWKAVVSILVINAGIMGCYWSVFRKLQLPATEMRVRGKWKLEEAALVGMFLAGLVVLGGYQRWWLEPLLMSLSDFTLFAGSIALTGVVDNAALTYLVSKVSGVTDSAKYLVMAGAVVGGGLTVIANAPNPVGQALLTPAFLPGGVSPLKLFLGALPATILAGAVFWFF